MFIGLETVKLYFFCYNSNLQKKLKQIINKSLLNLKSLFISELFKKNYQKKKCSFFHAPFPNIV